MIEIKLESTITCPYCEHESKQTMPADACQFFWECPSCKTILRPKEGDCCVFCSYGDNPCPPIQEAAFLDQKQAAAPSLDSKTHFEGLMPATKNSQRLAIDDIILAWASRFENVPEQQLAFSMRFQLAIIRLLVQGRPVTADQLSKNVGLDIGRVETILDMFRKSGAEVAEDGAIVGLILTTRPTPHRFVVNEQELFAWCALDTLFLPAYVGRPARVNSQCPVTGKEIHLLISPDGIKNYVPSSAVISVVTDPSKVSCSTTGADSELCSQMLFFYSRASAESWQKGHPETAILDLDEAFRVAQVFIEQIKLAA